MLLFKNRKPTKLYAYFRDLNRACGSVQPVATFLRDPVNSGTSRLFAKAIMYESLKRRKRVVGGTMDFTSSCFDAYT